MHSPSKDRLRYAGLGRIAIGTLVAASFALAAVVPAMADDDDDGEHGEGGRKHRRHQGYYYSQDYYQPNVIYTPSQPVYVQPAPVYVAPPPPPPVYYV
ncbi:MAG TPA: hypothetical protein VFE34_05280 [Dongiaceae bacterium]|jgi:hypothetical protein|nr:hypothetical protein [Dongiaceae bacterium]